MNIVRDIFAHNCSQRSVAGREVPALQEVRKKEQSDGETRTLQTIGGFWEVQSNRHQAAHGVVPSESYGAKGRGGDSSETEEGYSEGPE